MLRQLKNNNSGIVLMTMLAIIIISIVLCINIISIRITQSLTENELALQYRAEMMAHGMLALIYSNRLTNSAGNTFSETYLYDGVNWVVNGLVNESGSGIYGSNPLDITVYY